MVESWVIYGTAALLLLGVVNFLAKYLSEKVPVPLLLVTYLGAAFFTSVLLYIFYKAPVSFPQNTLPFSIFLGVLLSISIFLILSAFSLGLGSKVVTVINMNTVVTVILLVLLLGEKLTPKIGLGIGFAVVSLYLLTS